MMDAVIQFTRLNIREVYDMAAAEFFTYVDYVRSRERRRTEEIKKIQRR